jgi:hypothetical protein
MAVKKTSIPMNLRPSTVPRPSASRFRQSVSDWAGGQINDSGWAEQLYFRPDCGHVPEQGKQACRILSIGKIPWSQVARQTLIEIQASLSVAGFALSWCRLVEKDGLPLDLAGNFVAVVTGDISVSTLERKRSALVVVKLRWLPACRIMATGTVGGLFASCELTGVGIGVTSVTVFRRDAEINIFQAGFERLRAMAVGASYAAVSSEERKFCFRMIKAVKFLPPSGRMASFAARKRTVRTLRFHLFAKLPFVRILVTCCAGAVFELVFHGRRRSRGDGFVTIRA